MSWFEVLRVVGLAVLRVSPLAPIADAVADAIVEAETMSGKSGEEKLTYVIKVITAIASASSGIEPGIVQSAAAYIVSAAVDVTNIAHDVMQRVQKP